MSQRRMFSLKVIDTDKFLEMPVSARELYFQLSMRADDDGFVGNPKQIAKIVGAGEDDFNVLFIKQFIIPFESGVCVIRDWKIHNYIQSDRYQETEYRSEKSLLEEKDKKYALKGGNVSKMDTQVRLELGKSKVRVNRPRAVQAPLGREIEEIIFLFKETGINPLIGQLYGRPNQRAAVQRMLKELGREKLEIFIRALPEVNAKPFWPKSTTPIQLEANLGKYKAMNDAEKNKMSQNNKITIHQ